MILHSVECERVQPDKPEAYVCAWKDRNKLALGLLTEGKGCKIQEKPGIEGAQGIVGRAFAVVTVQGADEHS